MRCVENAGSSPQTSRNEYFTYGEARRRGRSTPRRGTPSRCSAFEGVDSAGWRIGYVVYPEALASAMTKSQDTILICPTIAAQVGAEAALRVGCAYCEPFVAELQSIRDTVLSELGALAPLASVPAADGAFYAFVRVNTTMKPLALAERLIREHKVAVIPGMRSGPPTGATSAWRSAPLQKATVAEGPVGSSTGCATS